MFEQQSIESGQRWFKRFTVTKGDETPWIVPRRILDIFSSNRFVDLVQNVPKVVI